MGPPYIRLMIIEKIKNFLHQPYPFYYQGKDLHKFCLVIFGMALFFNYVFQPFSVYEPEHKFHYFWISVIHSISPVILFYLIGWILKPEKHLQDNWILKNEVVVFSTVLFLTGVCQFLIRDIIYDNSDNWSWHYLFEEISNTLLVGFLFAAILVPINLNRVQKINQIHADVINNGLKSMTLESKEHIINIQTQVKADDFLLDIHEFIYAKADGNYLEIVLQKGEQCERLLKRITSKELENQLAHFDFIMKVHRSFLVNLNKIESVSGNAGGYKVAFKGISELVPVSRNYIPTFDEKMKVNV